jgi:hypothetical protein
MNEHYRRSVVLLFAGSALAGCASIFGIDDLPELSPSAAAGKSASGAAGHDGNASGGAQAGRSSGGGAAAGKFGAAGHDAGAGAAGEGGELSSSGGWGNSAGTNAGGTSGADAAGAPAAGAGEGGSDAREGTPIHGSVIDGWGHPLAGIQVALGKAATTTTETGEFTFSNVPETYDLSLFVQWTQPSGAYGWIYQGLTRRDPTLQVYQGSSYRDVEFTVSQSGGHFTSDSIWLLALGSPNGSWLQNSNAGGAQFDPVWEGPTVNTWSIHSLLFEASDSVPSSYTAYEQTTRTVTTNDDLQSVTLDLSASSPASDYVSGTIDDAGSGYRENYAFVRFASGASLPVVNGVTPAYPSFSYLVPDLPGGSITLAASDGMEHFGAYSIAHANGVAAGATGVVLDIPAPATQLTPADGAPNLSDATSFEFTSGQPDVGGFVVKIVDQQNFEGLYIVTSKTHFALSELPAVPTGFRLAPGEPYGWQIETHGKPASVDEMCGPAGFIDEFAESTQAPMPARGSGSFTVSKGAQFTTAP